MDDVRDLRGRLARLAIATVLGIVTSLVITYLLPTRDHFERMGGCMRGEGWFVRGGDPVIMLAGAVGAALAWCALLEWLARRARRVTLPRATLLR